MIMATTILGILIAISVSAGCFTTTEAYEHQGRDHESNVTVKWDVMSWTPDGYVAVVTIYNFQHGRGIEAPGWRLGWRWAQNEVIWSTVGGRAIDKGDCSRFKGNTIPYSCTKTPTIMDMKLRTPLCKRVANCCKGGVLAPWFQHRPYSISSFQISVGQEGNTVKLPMNFIFQAPTDIYNCGPAKIGRHTMFITPDKRRVTQSLMTWNVTCLYSGKRSRTDRR